jgi:hypothetical protein
MELIIQHETAAKWRHALVINEDRGVKTLTCWHKNSFSYKLIQNANTKHRNFKNLLTHYLNFPIRKYQFSASLRQQEF